jgi:predicted O-methyltransferase YrrM
MLDLKAALPPTRGWAASPDLLLTLTSLVRKHKPNLVVELGSGASTIILSRAGAVEIVAIEHDLEYLKSTQELLSEHQVNNVQLIHAPLIEKEILEETFTWYDSSKLQDLKEIDFLFIDGPPGSKDDAARFPALPVLGSKLSKNAVVVIDDTKRSGEKALAESFANALPNHRLRFLDHEKGTAILEPM